MRREERTVQSLNITIVALVALVAIVGVTAIVLNGPAASRSVEEGVAKEAGLPASEENLAGAATLPAVEESELPPPLPQLPS